MGLWSQKLQKLNQISRLQAQLVIQTAFLGDLILTIPFLRRLKKLHPEIQLLILCKKGLGQFLHEHKLIDQFIEIDKGDRKSYAKALLEINKYDIVNLYCVHRSVRSQLFAAQIPALKKIGYTSLLGFWIFDELVEYDISKPDVLRKFLLIQHDDAETNENLNKVADVNLNQANQKGILPTPPAFFSFVPSSSPFVKTKSIGLFPGSVWATKKWTEEGYRQLAQKFLISGYKVYLLGGSDEKEICERIALKAPGSEVLAGKLSISDSIKKISELDLVVANDSAATHMATFAQTPVVTVFGPTTLELGFRPWSEQSRVVQVDRLQCRPCGKHGHSKCPLGHHHCMTLIQVEDVYQKSLELLSLNESA